MRKKRREKKEYNKSIKKEEREAYIKVGIIAVKENIRNRNAYVHKTD